MIRGADLIIPLGERGKEQQTESEVKMTKKIANLRIHEERAINRFKHFRILQHTQRAKLTPVRRSETDRFLVGPKVLATRRSLWTD